jgi:hypothetical protein
MKKQLLGAVGAAAVLTGALVAADTGGAADHLEAPLVALDGRTDINDVYAFANGPNTVLVMTVNPGAGVLSPTTFDPDAVYRFQIDNDGDAKKDKTIRVRFGEPDEDGRQQVKIRGAGGKSKSKASGTTGETIELPGGGQAIASTFDDPFYFDFEAFLGTVKGQGTRSFCDGWEVDFFAGLNVSAIVLEVPGESLTDGDSTISVWGETKNKWGRVDRMGKPAIATVLINDGNEDAFNKNRPHRDVRKWAPEVSNNLQVLSGLDGDGYDATTADSIANLLLPDVLTLDTTSSDGFVPGLNGRQPVEDVIDFELFVVTGGLTSDPVLTTDCVDANDVAFPTGFPYLAAAHS